jgi:uncharacterized protein YndB with AHSA1/START domain
MRSIAREIVLPWSVERTFALLYTPSAIRGWWNATSAIVQPRRNGVWTATWGAEDSPDYVCAARLVVFEPPRRLVMGNFEYLTKHGPGHGPGFQADLESEFTVDPHEAGSILRVEQRGFPDEAIADDFYASCVKGWKDTFDGIARFVAQRSG